MILMAKKQKTLRGRELSPEPSPGAPIGREPSPDPIGEIWKRPYCPHMPHPGDVPPDDDCDDEDD
jgi:hypothetical protein